MAIKEKYYSNYKNDARRWKNRSRTDDRSKRISYILMFFIALSLTLSVLFNSAYISFLNNSKIKDAFADEKIVSMVRKEAAEKFRKAFKDYDIDENLVNSVLSDKAIKSDLNSLVISGEKGFNANIYSKKFVIVDKIEEYLLSKGQKVSEVEKEKLLQISEKFLDEFSEIINFRFWGFYAKLKSFVSYYSIYFEISLLAVTAILFVFLYKQKRKYTHRFFRYSCEAFWSASVALALLYLAFKARGINADYDFTSGEIFEIFITNLFGVFCMAVLSFTVFLFVLGLICFVTSHIMREQFIRQYKHKSNTKGSDEYHKEIISFLEDGKYEGKNNNMNVDELKEPENGQE